jgi:hypothetical protein
MNKGQWTVTGLIIALAALEIIRSPNVKGFFSGFFSQFGIPASGSSSGSSTPGLSSGTGGANSQSIKGFPSPGGGHPS